MDVEIYGVALLPIVVGLIQIVKQFRIPNKFLPIVSILISEALCMGFLCSDDLKKAAVLGLQMGLAASGLYSGSKHMIGKNGNGD